MKLTKYNMIANIMDIVAPAVWIIPPEMLSKNGVVVTASIIMGTAKYTNLTRNIFTPFISISFRLLNSGTLSVPLIIPQVEISSILYSYPKNKNPGINVSTAGTIKLANFKFKFEKIGDATKDLIALNI